MSVFLPSPDAIILHREDIRKLLEYTSIHASLRDCCVIRVPSKCGFRPGEARFLKWEQIDFESLTITVVDSKNYEPYPVPMDPITADYLRQLRAESPDKYVFAHDRTHAVWRQWQNCPLGYDMMGEIVKRWARAAGCQGWRKMNMYLLRHYFAACWAYPENGQAPGNLHALSRIMRHKSLAYTQIYLSKLVFYEDLQREYNRIQQGPFTPAAAAPQDPQRSFSQGLCSQCTHDGVCRYQNQAESDLCSWATGCRFYAPKIINEQTLKANATIGP